MFLLCQSDGDPVDRICLMHALQMLWDRAEPAGFLNLLVAQPEKTALFQYGLGDSQVSWLGAFLVTQPNTRRGK